MHKTFNPHGSYRATRLSIYGVAAFFMASLIFINTASAGGPVVWEITERAELLRGEARGVSVTDAGALTLAPQVAPVFDTTQSFVWSSATDAAGNVYLGTGHDGRIFRVGATGGGALFYDAAELDVTALAVGRDGSVYAGTSPDGRVYRIGADGRAETFFDPPDRYIWSLAVMPDGALAVGTGDNGKIYRVRAGGASPGSSVLIDTDETHIISLAVDRAGQLIAGTDPGGLVLRVSPEGRAFALFDAPLREIHALTVAADNSIYVLALGDAASTRASLVSGAPPAGATVTSVTISPDSSNQSGSSQPARNRNDLTGARSAVFRLRSPDGASDTVWSSTSVTAFAIAPLPDSSGALIGTSDRGRIYRVTNDGRDTLLVQTSEGQISSFIPREGSGGDIFITTSNAGKLFRLTQTTNETGTYESPVRDARFVAAWGRIRWRGAGAVELQTRTGNTEQPDATWSQWSAPYTEATGAAITSPRARFIQWRATLRRAVPVTSATTAAARVENVQITYLPRNVAPEVLSITTFPVGVGLQPQVQSQIDPNIEASNLDPAIFGAGSNMQAPPRRIYQRGALSLQWQAEDPNGDSMQFSIFYRPLNEQTFRLLQENVRENFYTVDGAALGDGRYVFKIVASDAPENPPEISLTGERVTEPVDVDATPPVVRVAREDTQPAGRARIRFTVEDATGFVRRADVSIDGETWRAIFPEDGIADSPRETYVIDVPLPDAARERTITLRAFDTSGNVGSARFVVRR
jgi:hypothetical protein